MDQSQKRPTMRGVPLGKTDWCAYTSDGRLALCARESEGSFKHLPNAGWLHKLTGSASGDLPSMRPVIKPPPRPAIDATGLAKRYVAAGSPALVAELGEALGVSYASLERLRVGWADHYWSYSWPMRNHLNEIIGIRLRHAGDGHKFAVPGSRSGLFIPALLGKQNPLIVCEGPTDLAALLDLGYCAIGRPSCAGGADLVVAFVERKKEYRDIIIIHDQDKPGSVAEKNTRIGAELLAARLRRIPRAVKVLAPPKAKDVRDWVREGATRTTLDILIRQSRYVAA